MLGHKRQKRGLFDFIGSVSKYLFGTLDEDDAKYYNKKIKSFDDTEQSVLKLVKEQVSVVKATISNFNETIGNLNYNEKILISNFQKLDIMMTNDSRLIEDNNLHTIVNEHISVFSLMFSQYQLDTLSLIDAILFAQLGKLHPMILTPSRLLDQLVEASKNLSNGLDFPINLNTETT